MRQRLVCAGDIVPRVALFRTCWLVVLVCATLWPPAARAAEDGAAAAPGPWEISADRISHDMEQQAYVAEGNVSIFREGRRLTADEARFFQITGSASAWGNVRLTSGKDVLTGDRLDIDLESETGILNRGSVFLEDNHLYLSGEQIRKTGPDSYSAASGTLTTCDGPDPDWRITAKDVAVTIEGYGFARHAAFWAGDIPLMYSPYLAFPVKQKRQTGLLTPELGLSDRKGAQYLQPFFWAIDESQDATLFADIMAERGVRLGGEYRYALSPDSLGTIMIEGLDDRQVDDGRGDSSDQWGYTNDSFTRPNRDRYWVRAKADQELPWEMTAKLDLDIVSDQDYLHEFRSGFNGLTKSSNYFAETFGRDLDDYTEQDRLNQLNLNRTWNSFVLNTDLRWFDNPAVRRWQEEDTTLQNLPEISFIGVKQRIGALPLFANLDTNHTYFYRQDGTRGHRTDLYPRLSAPMRLADALNIEPSVGVRQTAWDIERWDTSLASKKSTYSRTMVDAQLDASTDFFRVYDKSVLGFDRVKHVITPDIGYQYRPEEDQKDYPYFDPLDRLTAQNLIVYSLTHTLVGRSAIARQTQAGGEQTAYRYVPFLRFNLEESFNVDKYRADEKRPFSNILAELDLTPGRIVRLSTDLLWSPYDQEFYGYSGTLRLWNERRDQLSAIYRQTRSDTAADIESINLRGLVHLDEHWQLRGIFERNLTTRRTIESGMGISYVSQCWAVDFDYGEEEGNRSFSVVVHLNGLGSIGN
jgi:LPS-assembly protein